MITAAVLHLPRLAIVGALHRPAQTVAHRMTAAVHLLLTVVVGNGRYL
ncbi:hypothetical protein PT340_000845 [Acinetobacter baumannii]|nr:hypothetical protein [Acinetobacter baumannii]ELA7031033.1 hypothetical protein [Acinetobacter baumannii]ELA7118796.1 hypothetical protein [Acinetobacter baumannii]ELB0919745.1 hypothetical protein [Acinetobacter baumannii]ELB0965922.1 hypothetical protein [Acinetobacter baumannii]